MNELDRWMSLLLSEGVSPEGIKEFESIYKDMIYSTAMSNELNEEDVFSMFEVINMMGEDNAESEMMRRYLYYVYGKFIVADIYAAVVADMVFKQNCTQAEASALSQLLETAIEKIIKQ